MQIPPSSHLAHIIKHYLILESNCNEPINYRLFSDGNPGMVFYFKTPLMQQGADQAYAHPNSFVYGQLTQYKDLVSTGKLDILVVVFQPYGLYALSGVASVELNDSLIKLNELFKSNAEDLEDRVLNENGIQNKIEHIENLVFKKLAGSSYPDNTLTGALKLIDNSKGNISVAQLLHVLPITEKQLERRFNQFVGIGPKRFTAIVKLQYFLKNLQRHSQDVKIADAAYESGYYDQAHLNNYFKKNIGITPSAYKINNLLAINFMQV
ncbi:helix-turn-helix domain-containing protein [Mucilaginibacter lappiensis]|uniref:AraC-like DNA-binding protein n=1 Tax=Mucilaginibacter lappiensis TaxID=354630 RepID=A0A841JE89_9SPHI|nr:helix-turn-helix domain-containing protein [Mucilaginibacter lappiensis]MBB6126938.1 AraC-like DNA-binding protein [Mucilaginibacter lappiensis]